MFDGIVMSYARRQKAEIVTLADVTAATATASSSAMYLWCNLQGMAFQLDVTSAATVAADTLTVVIQGRTPGGVWFPLAEFTEVAGDGGAIIHVGKTAGAINQDIFSAVGMSAGARHVFSIECRVRYYIVSDTDPSFNFVVTACPM